MKLADLPKERRTVWWIAGEIAYEAHLGVHTKHPCPCGRGVCRSSRCLTCWAEALVESSKKKGA